MTELVLSIFVSGIFFVLGFALGHERVNCRKLELDEAIRVKKSKDNTADRYERGFLNGLIFARSIICDD